MLQHRLDLVGCAEHLSSKKAMTISREQFDAAVDSLVKSEVDFPSDTKVVIVSRVVADLTHSFVTEKQNDAFAPLLEAAFPLPGSSETIGPFDARRPKMKDCDGDFGAKEKSV